MQTLDQLRKLALGAVAAGELKIMHDLEQSRLSLDKLADRAMIELLKRECKLKGLDND